ncbi:CFC_collapsed_G0057500.mRNA.1.CDS.1 [Saccharomyces cerevisiae]|nr:CFC_collapsed_G0057500.mRNA.1.CDS.1 [Saccharomyces cerevisiae]
MSISTSLNSASIHLSSMDTHPQLHSLTRQPHSSSTAMSKNEAQESSPSLPASSSSSTSASASASSKNSSKNPFLLGPSR